MVQAKEVHAKGPSFRKQLVRIVIDVVRLTKTVKVITKLSRKINKALICSKNKNMISMTFNAFRKHYKFWK